MIRNPGALHKRPGAAILPDVSANVQELPDGSATTPQGFTAAAAAAGLKAGGALDVALLVSATSCATAGVFTKNAVRAAPVLYDQDLLSERPGRVRAVAMNARVANACTGADGLAAARAMAQAAAHLAPDGGLAAARAIMTTDTRPKHCAVRLDTPGGPITIGGIAKGAGMIHPDMATLLAVLTTDAACDAANLAPLLKRVADRSFNAISVDGDTSTNDTVLLLANGASGIDPSRDGAMWKAFEDAVQMVARTLALAIVQDGEGATKLLEIHVINAPTETAAREVGRAIARSALVKTAIYGADPNWGRILAAAGAAGVPLPVDRLRLEVAAADDWLTLATAGATAHPDLARARAIFAQKTIRLRLDLGIGRAEAVVWTCDLTPEYVRINADYTS